MEGYTTLLESTVKLTKITREDLAQWKAMRKELYPTLDEMFDEKEMERIFNHKEWACQLITDYNETILGFVEISLRNFVDGCLSSPVAYIEGLFLKPQYRQQGLGKEVIKQIMAWCIQHGYSELATDTELENLNAQAFYKSVGFQETYRVVEFRIDVNKIGEIL